MRSALEAYLVAIAAYYTSRATLKLLGSVWAHSYSHKSAVRALSPIQAYNIPDRVPPLIRGQGQTYRVQNRSTRMSAMHLYTCIYMYVVCITISYCFQACSCMCSFRFCFTPSTFHVPNRSFSCVNRLSCTIHQIPHIHVQ
jgi:hypothetical protein